MKIDEYISHLRDENIIITVKEDKIAVEDPNDVLTSQIIDELKSKRLEILDFFGSIKTKKESFIPISKAPVSNYYPLSSAQQRMYFLYEFDKNGTTYNMPMFLKLEGNIDFYQLEKTFKKLVNRHESLRTIFELQDGNPVQRLAHDVSFSIEYAANDNLTTEAVISGFIRPFDLSKQLPIRVIIIKESEHTCILGIDLHHIVSDGRTMEILMHDFWSLYSREALNVLPIQYKDYAVWQQSKVHQTLVSSHKSYWLDTFAGDFFSLELPVDYSRSLEQSDRGDTHSIHFNKSQSDKLRAFISAEGITTYTFFLAIYNILLSRLSNQDDVIVGTSTLGRHHSDLEEIAGMFVNTLALRNRVDSDRSFSDFLFSVQESAMRAFDHHTFQYEELVETLDIPRTAGRNPLFDVFFSYRQEMEGLKLSNSNIKIEHYNASPKITAKFDLNLAILDSEEISLSFTYRTDLFKQSSISRFSDYMIRIIETVLENPNQLIKNIEILSKKEKLQLLVDFNDTAVDYDLDETVLDMFVAQSLKTPYAEAIVFGEERLTYHDLNTRSDRWASNLMESGIISGSIVGLIMSRSTEMITAILSVMKAGAAYLPIDPEQPLSRTLHILKESGSSFVIGNLEVVPDELKQSYLYLGTEKLDKTVINRVQQTRFSSPDDLAYVIYTSGSTGQPKGVMTQHKNVSNFINYERDFLNIDASDSILQFSPYYFDASVKQIWLALTTGAKLVLVNKNTLSDRKQLINYLEKESVTMLNVTPSFLNGLDIPKLFNLKRIVASGEECKVNLAEKYYKEYDFYNEYGPTETTVITISGKVTQAMISRKNIAIGRPIANAKAFILDTNLNLVPIGFTGQLYIAGKGLSKGYLNRPELTESQFINNPFGEGKVYKTGDLARWLPDGTIEFLGRLDDQIKLNGVRIELGEIESQLNTFKGIKDAVVSLREIQNTKFLIAYYVSDDVISPSELRSHLIDQMPFSMIPSYYMQLDKLPLSPTGKLDRRLLPDPKRKEWIYKAPSNEIEKQLVAIWSELLQLEIEKINVDDGFFELGGNSLKAISLVNTISKTLSVKITLKEIFIKQTIREIADYIMTVNQIKSIKADINGEVKLVL